MNHRRAILLLLALLLTGAAGSVWAATSATQAAAAAAEHEQLLSIMRKLQSGQPGMHAEGIADIKALQSANPVLLGQFLRQNLGTMLINTGERDLALDLATALLRVPSRDRDFHTGLLRLRATALLASGKEEELIAELRAAVAGSPTDVSDVLDLLLAPKRYDDVLALGQAVVLARADELPAVENCLRCRMLAFSAQGKHDAALAEGKRLFNVCAMKSTARTLLLLVRELAVAHPGDTAAADQFRREQIAGAAQPASTEPAAPESGVLAAIVLDPQPYLDAAKAVDEQDFASLTRRGNLLLLAGDVSDAEKCFRRAYMLADDRDLQTASESIARCMRAEDGTVGRANAWVMALRPAAKATTGPVEQ